MKNTPKILILVVYFGKLPTFFEFTLRSMEFNSKIDWLFFTDQEVNSDSRNIYVKKITFEQFTELLQNEFDFKISLERPYKICDFRPAFGLVMNDSIQGYDFWGHCDLDLILGDILGVLPKEAWNSQKVLARGSLSFYKNNSLVNELFQKQIDSTMDYRVVFSRGESLYFDEWHGINRKFELGGMKVWNDDSFLFDINKNRYGLHTTDNARHGVWIDSQKVFMLDNASKKRVEGAYVHLQKSHFCNTA